MPHAAVSPLTALGLGALRVLSRRARDWEVVELAEALDVRADRLAEVVGRLAAAGWVHLTRRAGRLTYRYADPRPIPTLGEVIAAIDGAGAADDCALGLARCGGLTGGPTCGAHHGWLRRLNASALLALSLVPPQATRTRLPDPWHDGAERDEDRATPAGIVPDAADPAVAASVAWTDGQAVAVGYAEGSAVGIRGPGRRDDAGETAP